MEVTAEMRPELPATPGALCPPAKPHLPHLPRTLPEDKILRLRMARRDGGVMGDLGKQRSFLEAALKAPQRPSLVKQTS